MLNSTFAYAIFISNLENLKKSLKYMSFSFHDSRDILLSNESELHKRDYLYSDNTNDAIIEQQELEINIYNQMYVLLISYVEYYFQDVIKMDLNAYSKSELELLQSTILIKKICTFSTDSLLKIAGNRFDDLIKSFISMFEISDLHIENFKSELKYLRFIRNDIVHHDSKIKIDKLKDAKFEKFLEINFKDSINNYIISLNFDLVLNYVSFFRKELKEIDNLIYNKYFKDFYSQLNEPK